MTHDDRVDRLHGLPLEEFVAERDLLAKELRAAGDKAAANEVKALRKPSLAAWAVNQLARRHQRELQALLHAGAELAQAQRRAASGAGADTLREASRLERELANQLVDTAAGILAKSGHAATDAQRTRIADTLRAAVVDEEAREQVAAGRLAEDLSAPGFGQLDGLTLVVDAEGEQRAREAERDEQEAERLRKRADDLADEAGRMAAAAEDLEARAERARAEAAQAEARAAEARKQAGRS